MKSWFQAAFAAAMVLTGFGAEAQTPAKGGSVETRLEARRVVKGADGQESFAPAETAKPGDLLEYVATYRNTTRQPVRDLQATLPIPDTTEFVAGSQKPGDARASLDGQAYSAMPLRRKAERNGSPTDDLVPVREYRSLRWSVPELAGEKTVAFSARVRVLDDRSTGPPPAAGGRP